eukprot:5721764-Lingulodinium_polyedra.AAC.1
MDKSDTRRPAALWVTALAPMSVQAHMIAEHPDHLGCYAWQHSRSWDHIQSNVPSGECTHRLA